jgi:indole-3-glycerol phosphate synthase
MNATEQHVVIAEKMYECRAAARRLLGDKYHTRMEELARVVRAVAKRDNSNDIVAGATVIKEFGLQGMDALLLMAAVVEMTEPSNA